MKMLQLVVFVRGNYWPGLVPSDKEIEIRTSLVKAQENKTSWTFRCPDGSSVYLRGGEIDGFYFMPAQPSVPQQLLEEVKKANAASKDGDSWKDS